jgi:hypothetical protein
VPIAPDAPTLDQGEEPAIARDAAGGGWIMAILKNSKAKLDEARFFLSHLQAYRSAATSGNPRKPNPEPFAYYLSAFISAARSVTWVLQAEQKEKYDAWLAGWEDRRRGWAKDHGVDDIDSWLKLTNDMRLEAVKREGQVKTRSEIEMIPIASWENNHHHINVVLLGLSSEDALPRTSSETRFIDGTDQEVVQGLRTIRQLS